ncbi:MAG: hypothetical protein DWQ07_22060 [Chloroflexi bacterium]|nr:MAG: hypothetical protein DWQ07_22060 [Chloroflexota bacterium]MBL1196360.1 hypothetical protein [Chloroflexota bacterium]NOH13655.1 AAA family ATPase [Chloroflexota bacterium]
MKLIHVNLHGYKRFFNKTKIDLKSKEIALIGPNEVGKSSVLLALLHFEKDDEFLSAGVNRELTRNQSISGDQYIVSASYLLSSGDVDAISHFDGGDKVKWFHVHKDADGYFYYSLEPDLKRDRKLRRGLLSKLERLRRSRRLKDILSAKTKKYPEDEVDKATTISRQLEKAISDLRTDVDSLDDSILVNLSQLGSSISNYVLDTDPSYLQPLSQKVVDVVSFEQTDSPSEEAIEILKQRRPRFILFSDADRNLHHEYSLVVDGEYPIALRNLTQLAGLDLPSLRRAVESGDRGRVVTLISRANTKIKEVFQKSWSQSKISVHFDVNGQALNIMVDNDSEINSIAERSDGLRQYVGLRAFVENQTGKELVLLLDEIERHLHYDAQVDLIQMFAKQDLVSKVIYTTHSIGCLPEDLGLGVRLIEPEQGEENLHINRSTVNNWFWTKNKPGLHSLLSGMGASLLAFFPLRYALFTEGPTDMILLPTIFREVAGKDSLGF